jgi:hypothetical protein
MAGGRSQTVTDTQIASPMPGDIRFDEASEIVQDANAGTFARTFPSETMCPDWTEETPGAKH